MCSFCSSQTPDNGVQLAGIFFDNVGTIHNQTVVRTSESAPQNLLVVLLWVQAKAVGELVGLGSILAQHNAEINH